MSAMETLSLFSADPQLFKRETKLEDLVSLVTFVCPDLWLSSALDAIGKKWQRRTKRLTTSREKAGRTKMEAQAGYLLSLLSAE